MITIPIRFLARPIQVHTGSSMCWSILELGCRANGFPDIPTVCTYSTVYGLQYIDNIHHSHHRSFNSRKAKLTDKRLRRESVLDLLRTLAVHTSQHYGHRLQDRIYSSVLLVNRFLFNCLFIMAWLRSRTGAKFANKSLV